MGALNIIIHNQTSTFILSLYFSLRITIQHAYNFNFVLLQCLLLALYLKIRPKVLTYVKGLSMVLAGLEMFMSSVCTVHNSRTISKKIMTARSYFHH